MRVLHVNWSNDALWVWGEESPRPTVAGPSPESDVADAARAHPFALADGDLRFVLSEAGVDHGDRAGSAISLALPTVAEEPAPSARLAHLTGHFSHELDTIGLPLVGIWRVSAIGFSGAEAPGVLERLQDAGAVQSDDAGGGLAVAARVAVGPTVAFFAAGARLARALVAEQRIVPMVLQEVSGSLRGAWRPWLGDERTAQRVGSLLSAAPAAARAPVDAFEHQPWPMLEDFLAGVIDAQCRAALTSESMVEAIEGRSPEGDLHVAWLTGLLGTNSRVTTPVADRSALVRHVRQWIARLDDRGADVAWRLCVVLNEPAARAAPGKELDRGSSWRLSFQLQAIESEHVTLDAEEIWSLSADAATVEGRRVQAPQELLLAELGRAARIHQPLEAALEEANPSGMDLSTRQAYAFLREARPLLLEQGFGVVTPDWWESPAARLGVRLEIDAASTTPATGVGPVAGAGDGHFGLASLVDYRWRISVGDTTLTLAQFEELAVRGEPLVEIDGRWVEIRPEDVRGAAEFVEANPGGTIRLGEALRLAYASEDLSGVSVAGIDARGWVAGVLGADRDERVPLLEQPASFIGTLRPYQSKGLAWLHFLDRYGLGACLADDMGLGKTIQLLALLLHERAAPAGSESAPLVAPTLLVAPTSVVWNWRREAARFAPSLRVILHHGVNRLTSDALVESALGADLVVTTYALVHRDVESLSRVQWARVVLDEAQNIKNPSAKQTQSLRAIPAPRRVALTGTPVENRLSELWSIMDFCNPGYLGPVSEFRRRFSMPIERRRDQQRTRQLRSLVQPFILRRLKSDPGVTADLPDKLETREYCPLTPEQAALYEAAVGGMLAEVDRVEGMQRRGVVLATLIRLKQICNHPANLPPIAGLEHSAEKPPSAARSGKAMRLLEMLDEVVAAGDQALIFTQFRRMGHLLASMIAHDLDVEPLFLHGGTPPKSREQMVDRFQRADGSSPIFLLSLKAGGLGMNLTAANHVFHFDRWWNPAVENQATDRAHRIGQTRTVHVHKFIVSGTLEERIDQMIEQKTELARDVIASGERFLTELSTAQLRDLLTLRADAVADE